MNPSRIFILRPVATSLLMVAILLAGLLAYRGLPLSALPEVDYPTIQVTTLYPGAGPEEMASLVTAPLERQLGQMPGLERMASTSSGGASVITLQFGLTLALDVAEQEVQAAINAAANLLPADLPAPPVYSKVNPADTPILTLAATSDSMPLPRMHDILDTRLAQKLSQLPGVGLVTLSGGQRPAMRVQVNPRALAAQGLALEDVRTAIGNANVNLAKGGFDGETRASTIDANDQLRSAEDYKSLILGYKNAAPIRLRDVADVIDGAENSRLAAWVDDKPGLILSVQRQPGANVVMVADRIKALLPQLQAELPGGIDVRILSDRTASIRGSVADVQFELVLAVALVVMVMYLFLRNWRATIIPAVAVPLSLVGTFAVMHLAGFSINNLTLMALTIAAGFVVDDAVVMIENISRHIEGGAKPMEAAMTGSRQIGFTIISLTFSLIAVLIPLLFMGDVVGRLFREFAITLAIAILISALVSLTLTPMMCARLLRSNAHEGESLVARRAGELFDAVLARYENGLNWVLDRQRGVLLLAVGTVALTALLYLVIPKGFFPLQDTGVIQGISEMPQSVSFAEMSRRQQALARTILADPAVESLSSFVGIDGINQTLNTGRFLINLKPMDKRADRVPAVIARLQKNIATLAGDTLYLQPLQDLTIDTALARTQYQMSVQSPNGDELALWTPRMVERMQSESALANVASDLQTGGLQAYLTIDRDSAGRLGVTTATINNALYNAFGQRLVSTIYTQSNQYRVVLEVKPQFAQSPDDLRQIYVPAANGVQTPLAAMTRLSERNGLLAVNHVGQFPSATISFNLAPGASLGEAVAAIHAAQSDLDLPASIVTAFIGSAKAFQASLDNTLWLILAAIVTMYIVLGILYESAVHPVTILSTLPSAGIGALLALLMTRHDLDIVGIIGIILLIGIVQKNAIMMIDFALDAQRNGHMDARTAIHSACLLRFRPILMTTMAAFLAALPLMLGSGFGAELRRPLGIAMAGGLMVSQVLTLFTTPVVYLWFDRLSRRLPGGGTVS